MTRLFLYVLLLTGALPLRAQEFLSVEKAVAEALENNYGIRLAKTAEDIAAINNSLGNAGFLPNVNLAAAEILSSNNIDQRFANGLEVQQNNVGADNFSAGVSLNWTIFDGFRMFAARNRLRETYALSKTELYTQVQQSIFEVLSVYYQLSMLAQQLSANDELIKLGRERLDIAEKRLSIGDASRTDLLQAKIDLNTFLTTKVNIKLQMDDLKQNLLLLIGRDSNQDFTFSDSIPYPASYQLSQLEAQLSSTNPEYQAAKSRLKISEFALKEVRGLHYPQIQLQSAYNLSRVSSEAGFALFNRNSGVNYGISAQLPLYGGGFVQREKKIAKANIIAANIAKDQTMAMLKAEMHTAFKALNYALEILAYEKEKMKWAEQQLMIANEQFRLNAISSLQIKDIQYTYAQVVSSYTDALYQAKLADLRLQRVSGLMIR